MNNRFIKTIALVASSVVFVSGCGDNSSFETPNTSGTITNSGTVSQTNFSLLTADVAPAVIDASTGVFTKTDVELTVFIGDRNNQTLTDSHTINFVAEYGLVEPSCTTTDGSCSVTWSAIKRPVAGGPASDGFVTITAYTIGEEGFSDTNGNNVFDDGDAGFDDIEEPFIDADDVHGFVSNGFIINSGDVTIDVVSTNDPTGVNQLHDLADGFFNGPGCTHSSLCGIAQSIAIFDDVTMSLVSGTASRNIGGTVTGLLGTGLVLQNNGGDDLNIVVDGDYTFATTVDDGLTYTVTVSTQPTGPSQTCAVANPSGNVSANVTNVDVTCFTNAFTIGGTVSIPVGETLVILNNNTNSLTLTDTDTTFVFTTLIEDGLPYAVTQFSYTGAMGTAVCNITNGSGNVPSANISNIDISCP